MTTSLAILLLLADALLLLVLWNRRDSRPILNSYVTLIVAPYLLRVSLFPSIPLLPDPAIAAGHLLVAGETGYLALPHGWERRWLLATGLLFAAAFGLLVWFGDSGTVTVWLERWQWRTAGSAAAMALGAFTGVYCRIYYGEAGWQMAQPGMAVAAYFVVDVAVNVLYRTTEWVWDFNRMLLGVDHGWHLAVVGVVIWRIGKWHYTVK